MPEKRALEMMVNMPLSDLLSDAFLFHALMENEVDSIYFKDRQCRLLRVSRKMAQSLGFSDPAELIGKTDIDLFGEAFGQGTRLDDLRVMETGRPIVGLIESRQLSDGQTNWTLSTKVPIRDESGNVIGLAGITRDINEIRQTEVALQHLATHDVLTGLPNRFLMVDRLSQVLARARRSGAALAILYIDIDRFKEVNDSRGHEFGDLLLRAVAQRLSRSVRQSDTVARIGGDEFVIILEAVHQPREADTVALNVERAIARPFTLARYRVYVTVSIGISLYPESGGDTETLLRAADYAMYLAKREGGNRHLACVSGMLRPGGGAPGEPPGPVEVRNPPRGRVPGAFAGTRRRRLSGRRMAGSIRTGPRSSAAAPRQTP
jgi:diguanylate cyclase (GGDEF)-like protein/PAS domain S-box-containing protein